ncbi:hypothetical protein INR49_026658 [Caranx melampygus]|nr:hypothetical protein INR49_026658 [Caranx melampygus]
MKTFTLAVAMAVMLACIFLQESSATSTEVVELEEPVSYDNPATEYQETSVMKPYSRQKRDVECRFCCEDVAMAIMLTCICLQESSATPIEVGELEEPVSYDNPATEYQETSVDSYVQTPYNRQKRDRCRFCCGCCKPTVCGVCCRGIQEP